MIQYTGSQMNEYPSLLTLSVKPSRRRKLNSCLDKACKYVDAKISLKLRVSNYSMVNTGCLEIKNDTTSWHHQVFVERIRAEANIHHD